jgi:hypothetical protein
VRRARRSVHSRPQCSPQARAARAAPFEPNARPLRARAARRLSHACPRASEDVRSPPLVLPSSLGRRRARSDVVRVVSRAGHEPRKMMRKPTTLCVVRTLCRACSGEEGRVKRWVAGGGERGGRGEARWMGPGRTEDGLRGTEEEGRVGARRRRSAKDALAPSRTGDGAARAVQTHRGVPARCAPVRGADVSYLARDGTSAGGRRGGAEAEGGGGAGRGRC